jgi:pyruvate dehydrogenase (quinone)
VATACGAKGFTIERPEDAEQVLREALAHDGPTVVQAVVDPNEPPMPGKIKTEQAVHFAKALARGQKDAAKIIKTIAEDQVHEVV